MTRTPLTIAAFVAATVTVLGYLSAFTVSETQLALVLQFGNPVRTIKDPGLHFKLPFVQNVSIYDKRLLDVDPNPVSAITSDNKRIVVDAYGRYRIIDPLVLRGAAGNTDGDRARAAIQQRIDPQLVSSLRNVVSRTSLATLLSDERGKVMQSIQEEVNGAARAFGIEIVDVRIGSLNLPPETSQSVFERMRSERKREAAEFRAQGNEQAQRIRSSADRERVVLLAEAQAKAQEIRGEGDALAVKIYADAFGKDAQFFAFYRSLQAYRTALANGETTTFVLNPDGDFFRFFRDAAGSRK